MAAGSTDQVTQAMVWELVNRHQKLITNDLDYVSLVAVSGPPAFLLPLLGLLGQTHLPNGTNQTSGLRLPPFFMHASGCGEFGFYFPGLDPGRRTNGTYGNGTEREEDGSFVSSYEKFVMYKSACGRGAEEEHEKNPAIVPEAKETPPHKTTTEATTTTSPTTTTTPSTTTTTTATTTTTTTATTTAPKSTRAPWPSELLEPKI
ncbi:hypothetical protein Y032_1060g3514 [Ancylostoma ceylanicum]|uniref:Uncharacterized protein n=1 Tax=Ancylostoma ceylanicum TaxID=53326 RepID=A0A016W8T3_9BILA|nr:hypothetical protein Y032_1060g3514 [Ancylostoma ceylanicum]